MSLSVKHISKQGSYTYLHLESEVSPFLSTEVAVLSAPYNGKTFRFLLSTLNNINVLQTIQSYEREVNTLLHELDDSNLSLCSSSVRNNLLEKRKETNDQLLKPAFQQRTRCKYPTAVLHADEDVTKMFYWDGSIIKSRSELGKGSYQFIIQYNTVALHSNMSLNNFHAKLRLHVHALRYNPCKNIISTIKSFPVCNLQWDFQSDIKAEEKKPSENDSVEAISVIKNRAISDHKSKTINKKRVNAPPTSVIKSKKACSEHY